jgi:hypothetical protein
MDLEETEAKNGCADEGRQEFSLPTDEIVQSSEIFLGSRAMLSSYPNKLGPQS